MNADGAKPTIQPGTTVMFVTGASFHIGYYENATLIANGTSSKPITFTATASNPTAGAWEGISFWQYSLNSARNTARCFMQVNLPTYKFH